MKLYIKQQYNVCIQAVGVKYLLNQSRAGNDKKSAP